MDLVYFVLASYGLTLILTYGKIFDPIRPNYHFFHCPMSIGFHVGWILWAINDYTQLFIFDYSIATALILSCISSGTSYTLNMIFSDEGINIKTG